MTTEPPNDQADLTEKIAGLAAATDPYEFELAWSEALAAAQAGADRDRVLHAVGERVTSASSDDPFSELARVWLRQLAAEVRTRGDHPLPDELHLLAQRAVGHAVSLLAPELVAFNRARAEGVNVLDFLRASPTEAAAMRELGAVVRDLRGSGVLTLSDTTAVDELVAFNDALSVAAQRSLRAVPEWLRVTRDDLLSWASTGGGAELPLLIRRLVIETGAGVRLVHFPGGSGVTQGGWDGVVEADESTPFVPAGRSGWELSVETGANKKSESDYTARASVADSETTYVAVICRQWTGAAEFAAQRRTGGAFKDVRGYNVDDLEAWLEQAPATSVWLKQRIGAPVDGVSSVHDVWSAWLASTTTPLSSALVLAGREEEAKRLRERVASGPGLTTIGGDVRRDEIEAFVGAAWHVEEAGPDGTADDARPLIDILLPRDDERLRQLARSPGAFALVAPSAESVVSVSGGTHHVIVPVPGTDRADLVLPRLDPKIAEDALEQAGLRSFDVADLGQLGRRSLLALRRRLARRPELHIPAWAQPGAEPLRTRVLLLNSWNATVPGDREAVANLVGSTYDQIETELRTIAGSDADPMFAVIDGRWHVISPMDTWLLIGAEVSAADVERFRGVVLEVFLERDPFLALDAQERFRASVDGVRAKYSGYLRRGLASSLALMAAVNPRIGQSGSNKGQEVAAGIVDALLTTASGQDGFDMWAALAPQLPLLAEAAPDVFIDSLQTALREKPETMVEMFGDAEPGAFGSSSSNHTHILWAVERIAWSPDYFDAAVSLLADLAELDPGGRLANRPSASLAKVFCPWRPDTAATAEQRVAALARLRSRSPRVAWPLLMSMLPTNTGFHIVDRGPEYRDWHPGDVAVLRSEFERLVDDAAGGLLDLVGDDASRWTALIKESNDLPPNRREELRGSLVTLAENASDDLRSAVWDALRKFVSDHREFADAFWSLPETEIAHFDPIVELFAPTSAETRHHWLFTNGFVTLGDVSRRDNYDAYQVEVGRRRGAAVDEIEAAGGLESVLAFAASTEAPNQVGAALARVRGERYDQEVLPLLDGSVPPATDFAFGYFVERASSGGWPLIDKLIAESDPSPSAIARLLRSAWDPAAATARAESLGQEVSDEYWRHFSYFGLGEDYPHAIRDASRLIAIGRLAGALDMLALYARRNPTLEYADAVASALEAVMANPESDPEFRELRQYEFDTLLGLVAQHREALGVQRAARIEWYFLPTLGHDPNAATLHHALADDPDFFVQMVTLIFYPTTGQPEEESSESHRESAGNAFRLLRSWSICPGTTPTGEVDPDRLSEWVRRARELLAEEDRVAIGDRQIGEALAAAPVDPDGAWPVRAVRQLLEDLQSDDIERGIAVRLFNNRGVSSRSLDEGGRQEHQLAANYTRQFEQLKVDWPRAASIHRGLARSYEADARREDAAAERRRRGVD
jgi:hypothetical protein